MQQSLVKPSGDARIQVMFHDRHASLRFSGNVTLGEIAATLEEISKYHADRPVAIYVTLNGPDCQGRGDERIAGIRLE